MRSKIAFALFALVAIGTVAAHGASPAPQPTPAQVNPLVQAIAQEHAQLAVQCPAHHLGAFVRAYPDAQYPDSFQMTTIQCQDGFLIASWQVITLQRSH